MRITTKTVPFAVDLPFVPGDEVWVVYRGKIARIRIQAIDIRLVDATYPQDRTIVVDSIIYITEIDGKSRKFYKVHATKKELIEYLIHDDN